MLKQSLLKLLPVLMLSFTQSAGMISLVGEFTPTKVMAQQQVDESAEIERLTQQLGSESDTERNNAVIELGKMGSVADSAIRELFMVISSTYPEYIRVNASISIKQIVESSESEILQLIKLLKHSNTDVRSNVAATICKIKNSSHYPRYRLESIYKIYEKYFNPKVLANLAVPVKQFATADRLAISQLLPLLKDQNPLVRANVSLAIFNFGESAKSTLPQLIPLLQDPDARVRANAVAIIGSMGAKSTLPQLIPFLQDPDAQVRANAVAIIGSMGTSAKSTISQILPLLKDSDSAVRFHAIFALQGMGKLTKSTIVQILPLLKDANSGIRTMAVTALGKMGKSSKAMIPQLVPLLKDPDEYVRSTTVEVLQEMGDSATSAIPGLKKLLEEARPKGRTIGALVYVISKTGSASSINSDIANLIPLLKDPDPRIRYIAADALGDIGDSAKSTIPQLIPLLKDPDRTVVNRTRTALKKLGHQE